MPYLLNVVYFLALLALSPWLLYKSLTTGKYRRGMWRKLTGQVTSPVADAPGSPWCVPSPRHPVAPSPSRVAWFHGVSVGEIHLLRPLVARFRERHPDWRCVISTTTDTGYDEACKRFPDLSIIYWPLDFSWAVDRALREVAPDIVILAECELWPNFLRAARKRGILVAVINARMSPRSFARWNKLKASPLAFLLAPFSLVDLWAVQTEEYAACYRGLGVPAERVAVSGSIKYDGVEGDRRNPRTQELRRLLDVRDDELVWIAGSTQDPEERIVLDIYRRALARHPNLRLFLVPRQKDRFDEVAGLLRQAGVPFQRRSVLQGNPGTGVTLIDTIGELGALWGLADLAFVGGSMDGRRGGQNMIEPAAYGAAVVFGPHVWNFRDTATRLVDAGAAIQIADAAQLETTALQLLADANERRRLGAAARSFVVQQQGATQRTLALLDGLLQECAASFRERFALAKR